MQHSNKRPRSFDHDSGINFSKKRNFGNEEMWADDEDLPLTPYYLEQIDRLECEAYSISQQKSQSNRNDKYETCTGNSSRQFLKPSIKNINFSCSSDLLKTRQTINLDNENHLETKSFVNDHSEKQTIVTKLVLPVSNNLKNVSVDLKIFDTLNSENNCLKQELEKIKEDNFSKTGEICILRENLTKANREVVQLQQQNRQTEENWAKEQFSREKQLQSEIEKLQTQLHFKEREISEIQEAFKQREAKQKISEVATRNNTVKHRTISPSFNKLNFVTHQQFMEKENVNTKSCSSCNASTSNQSTKTNVRKFRLNLSHFKQQSNHGSRLVNKILEPTREDMNKNSLLTLLQIIPFANSSPQNCCTNIDDQKKSSKNFKCKLLSKFTFKTVQSKSYSLAIQSLSCLIQEQNTIISKSPLSSAIGLLPIIEECLDNFINDAGVENSFLSLEGVSSKTPSNSLITGSVDGDSNFLSVSFEMAQSALEVLHLIICYDLDARKIILSDYQNKISDNYCNSEWNKNKSCKILNQLIGLASARFCNGHLINDQSILQLALSTLSKLTIDLSPDCLDKYFALIYDTVLPACLNIELGISAVKHAFSLLSFLLKANSNKKLCNQTEECFLLKFYRCSFHTVNKWLDHKEIVSICQEIMDISIHFLMFYETEFSVNLGNCDCIEEMLKCIFSIMLKPIYNNTFQESNNSLLLRKGISFLYQLHLHCNNFNELLQHQGIFLMSNLSKVFSKIKNVPQQEYNFFQELWDSDSDDMDCQATEVKSIKH